MRARPSSTSSGELSLTSVASCGDVAALHRPAVIRPVEQGLALAWAAPNVARLAMTPELRGMASHRLPPPDLAAVLVRQTAPPEVAAVPLEPAAWIVRMDPAL